MRNERESKESLRYGERKMQIKHANKDEVLKYLQEHFESYLNTKFLHEPEATADFTNSLPKTKTPGEKPQQKWKGSRVGDGNADTQAKVRELLCNFSIPGQEKNWANGESAQVAHYRIMTSFEVSPH